MTAVFDNSSANPQNPDPAATVKYGNLTTDEMFQGYFDVYLAGEEPWLAIGSRAVLERLAVHRVMVLLCSLCGLCGLVLISRRKSA